jgi:hypothetical protein
MVKHFGLWYGFLTHGLNIYFSTQGYYIFRPLDLNLNIIIATLTLGL